RVYETEDPRATHLREMSKQLGEQNDSLQWFELSRQIEDFMLEEKGINCNVDFYSASTFYQLGIPIDLFTTIFASSRSVGWLAHVLEQYANNRLIRP
ncbi:MAG: citrate/2-methylcitrate synthase, partial [bacterium]